MLMLRSFSRSSISYARSVMMLVVDQRNINKSSMVFEIKFAVSIKRGVLKETISSPWPWPRSLLIFENCPVLGKGQHYFLNH